MVDLRGEGLEEVEAVDDAAADGELDLIGAEQAQGFEEVLDAFALVDAADEEQAERAGSGRGGWGRAEALAVDAVGDDADGGGGHRFQ